MPTHDCYCVVDGCRTSGRDAVSFFRCPNDSIRCQQWKNALGFTGSHKYANLTCQEAYGRMRVCALHFDDNSFRSALKRRLKNDAVPSLTISTTSKGESKASQVSGSSCAYCSGNYVSCDAFTQTANTGSYTEEEEDLPRKDKASQTTKKLSDNTPRIQALKKTVRELEKSLRKSKMLTMEDVFQFLDDNYPQIATMLVKSELLLLEISPKGAREEPLKDNKWDDFRLPLRDSDQIEETTFPVCDDLLSDKHKDNVYTINREESLKDNKWDDFRLPPRDSVEIEETTFPVCDDLLSDKHEDNVYTINSVQNIVVSNNTQWNDGCLSPTESVTIEDSIKMEVVPDDDLHDTHETVLRNIPANEREKQGSSNFLTINALGPDDEAIATTPTASETEDQILNIIKTDPQSLPRHFVGPESSFREKLRLIKLRNKGSSNYNRKRQGGSDPPAVNAVGSDDDTSSTTPTALETEDQILYILKTRPQSLPRNFVGSGSSFRGKLSLVEIPNKRKRTRRYIGDMTVDDFSSPSKIKTNFGTIKTTVSKYRQIKALRRTVGRLKVRIKTLNNVIRRLRDRPPLISTSREKKTP